MTIHYFKGRKAMLTSLLFLGAIAAWLFVLSPTPVNALTIVEKSRVNMAPSEAKRIFVSIKNQTSYTWYGGSGKTSLYVYGASSQLKHSSWKAADLPATIGQTSVAPGGLATVSFWAQAPSKSGTYTERFLLGDGTTWHKNTVIEISFVVGGAVATASTGVPVVQPSTPVSGGRFANSTAYKADSIQTGGTEWQTDPGSHLTVTVQLKNVGNQYWRPDGTEKVSLYSLSNNFKDTSWSADYAAAKLPESVAPGRTATITLELRAPVSPGQYKEGFELRVNGLETITGSQFVLPIRVRMPDQFVTNPPSTSSSGNGTSGVYLAQLLLKPRGTFSVMGNDTVSVTYGIKNTGTAVWNRVNLKLKEIVPNLGVRYTTVRHDSWPSSDQAKSATAVTEPGQLSLLDFKVKAPAKSGNYTVRFALEADGQQVDGGIIDIPITVTADGYIAPETTVSQPTQTTPPTQTTVDTSNLPNEPIIRVGLYATTDNTLMVRGINTGMNLTQGGNTVCTAGAGQVVTVVYDRANGVYKMSGACTSQSSQYYVAVATDGISPLEVTDISRPVSWLPGANDNKFRGKLELRFTPKTDSVWVINELPVETYLKGIAETSNVSPPEFQKTLLTAARTYAMYHVTRATKHADEYYIVDAKYDQVYRGYGQEARSPNIVAAVDATRGRVVTYNGKIAITPYFSRSDGRTRDWSEVWGGSVEWCIGVPVPWDNGKTLWGHGVGMSASGALAQANAGQTWEQILKYYYKGIEIKPWYK